jgi:hypothetical protein
LNEQKTFTSNEGLLLACFMTTVIRKNAKPSELKKLMSQLKRKPRKPFDPKPYSGVLKLKKDPLELQKEWRRDWDRVSS